MPAIDIGWVEIWYHTFPLPPPPRAHLGVGVRAADAGEDDPELDLVRDVGHRVRRVGADVLVVPDAPEPERKVQAVVLQQAASVVVAGPVALRAQLRLPQGGGHLSPGGGGELGQPEEGEEDGGESHLQSKKSKKTEREASSRGTSKLS